MAAINNSNEVISLGRGQGLNGSIMNSEDHATINGDDQSVASELNPDTSDTKPFVDIEDQNSESSQSTDNVFDWIKNANHAYDSDDLENAKRCYLKALEFFEASCEDQNLRLLCLNRLGDICLRLKQTELAFQIFSRAKLHKQSDRSVKLALNIAIIVMIILCFVSIEYPSIPITANLQSRLIARSDLANVGVVHAATSEQFISPVRAEAEFKTADQLSTIKIANSDTLYRWDHGEVWGARYLTPNFSFGDILKLISGCRKKSEHFVVTRSDSLVDDTGLIFYRADAPEVKLVERMWWYAGFLNYCYEELKKYPIREEPWMSTEVGYSFNNPFTGRIEKPGFVALSHQNENPPALLRPGAILVLSTPAGDCTICGYDREGRLLTASRSNKPLLLQMRRGINVTEQYFKGFAGMNKVRKSSSPELFVLIKDSSMKAFLKGAETYVPTVAVPMFLASLTLSLILFRVFLKSPGRILSFSPMLVPMIFVFMLLLMSLGE